MKNPTGRRATYIDDSKLPDVTDDMFRELLRTTQPYTVVVLKPGPRYSPPGPDRDPEIAALIQRHGKRNMALRAAGLMPIICPIADGGPLTGIGVFVTDAAETDRIYSLDPAVQGGALTYEVHPTVSFPGSELPSLAVLDAEPRRDLPVGSGETE